LRYFGQQAFGRQREAGGGIELGDQVVVVGVEPLGHFQCRLAAVLAAAASFAVFVRCLVCHLVCYPTGEGEVTRQRRFATVEAEARRLAAEQLDVVRHMIVEGEVADRDVVQPRVCLLLPVACAQFGGGLFQFRYACFAAPVAFEGELQLALQADAWIAQCMNLDHDKSNSYE